MISIVMTCFNRSAKTRLALFSLFHLVDMDGIEVVCVNDGSTDDTEAVLSEFPVVGINRQKRGGQSRALGDGLQVATGDVLINLDNDIITLAPDWPRLIEKTLRLHRDIGIVGLPVFPVFEEPIQDVKLAGLNFPVRFVRRHGINGSVLAMRRDVFQDVGYPWINPQNYSCFDYEYTCRIRAAGWRAAYLMVRNRVAPTMQYPGEQQYETAKKRERIQARRGPDLKARLAQIQRGELFMPYYGGES